MKVYAIAVNTFREMIRNRILYILVLFGLLLIPVSALFATASVGDPTKFIQDFGLFSISIISAAAATSAGANLVGREIGKKTIYNILSKPISRIHFLLGKCLGLCSTLVLLSLLMAAFLMLFVGLLDGKIHWHLLSAEYFALLELLMITVVALFFSSVLVTPTVVAVSVVAIFIAGRSFGEVEAFFGPAAGVFGRGALAVLGVALPRLDWLALSDQIVYGVPIPAEMFLAALFYAVLYSAVLFLMAALIFQRREL